MLRVSSHSFTEESRTTDVLPLVILNLGVQQKLKMMDVILGVIGVIAADFVLEKVNFFPHYG